MVKIRYLVAFVLVFFSFGVYADVVKQQNKAYRSFWHPTYNGERLDYCTADGKECGEKVANRYCQMLGYDYASENIIAYNIGLTHFILSRTQCKGWRCNGFMFIDCASKVSHTPPKPYHYREKHFVVPRYDHYRVDWCSSHTKGCGAPAANAFCSSMGYIKARHFVKETQVGATRTIGSRELCFGTQCTAFKTIICSR